MNTQEIIKAVAELDGKDPLAAVYVEGGWLAKTIVDARFGSYLTSRDSIIAVIEKNYPDLVARHLCNVLANSGKYSGSVTFAQIMTATPRQLCEALLHATGKWKE